MTFLDVLNEIFSEGTGTNNTTSVVDLNDVDFANVSKEELDETIEALDQIKNNPIMSIMIPKEDIDDIKAAIQAKWDIAHDETEGEELPTQEDDNVPNDDVPEGVDEQLEKLVDEFIEHKLKLTEGSTFGALVAPYAKAGYLDFARFIYNHK